MAKKIKSAFWRVLSAFLSLFGITSVFTACPEYGMPTNIYVLEGTVTGTDGAPIKGIGVGVVNPYYNPDYTSPDSYYCVTAATDKNGKYKLKWSSYDKKEFSIYFVDIDGEENGSYSDKLVQVEFTYDDFTGISTDSYYEDKNYKITNKNISLDSLK